MKLASLGFAALPGGVLFAAPEGFGFAPISLRGGCVVWYNLQAADEAGVRCDCSSIG